MAIHGYKGGVISATPPTTSVSGASGVWTTEDQMQAGANWPVAPALLSNSVRFRSSASAYMSRSTVAGNQQKFTISTWLKYAIAGADSAFFSSGSLNNDLFFQFNTSSGTPEVLQIFGRNSSVAQFNLLTSQVFRDPSAWYHIVIAFDTTQATSSNRIKLYVNGSQVTAFSTATYPSQYANIHINESGGTNYIGNGVGSLNYFSGYQTEINFVDGQALTPNYFGAIDGATGVWQPATYHGTYGNNGFYLPMNKTFEGYSLDYLVLAGGAAAGNGGGGGAGGLVTGSTILTTGTSYTITVGSGGAGQNGGTPANNGNSSALGSIATATGGGAGSIGGENGHDGGSGGGGRGAGYSGGTGSQGNNGGAGASNAGGGGGGAGATGSNASSNAGGNGGNGSASSITGSSITYAGGGGGSGSSSSGSGGSGGGGNAYTNQAGGNGTANLGGGGGGVWNVNPAGSGGSGVVILRMLTANYSGTTTGSPTVTTDGSYTVVKFTSSGSYTA